MRFPSPAAKFIAGSVSLLFLSQSVFAGLAESRLWDDRKKGLDRQESSHQWAMAAPGELPSAFQSLPEIRRMSAPVAGPLRAAARSEAADRWLPILSAIPLDAATLQHFRAPAGARRLVLHIEDVHRNAEAQKNIARVVSALAKTQDVSLVGLEGAFAPLRLDAFAGRVPPAVLRVAADFALRGFSISGPVFALLSAGSSSMKAVGVDDFSAYAANVAAYRSSRMSAPVLKARVAATGRRLAAEKRTAFSPALAALDRAVSDYHDHRSALSPYLEALVAGAGRSTASVDAFRSLLTLEAGLNFPAIEAQRSRLVEALAPRLSADAQRALLSATVAFRAGRLSAGSFYGRLVELCRQAGVRLTAYPALSAYVRYTIDAESVDMDRVLSDAANLEAAAYGRLSTTAAQREIVRRSDVGRRLSALLDFALSSTDWRRQKGESDADLAYWGVDRAELRPFLAFYENAEIRDGAMAARLLKSMDESHASSALLVTGGFHAEGVGAALEKAGVAVVTIMPRLTSAGDADGGSYLSVFNQEHTPLERLFQGEKLFLADAPYRVFPFLQAVLAAGQASRDVPTSEETAIARAAIGDESGDIVARADDAAAGIEVVTASNALGLEETDIVSVDRSQTDDGVPAITSIRFAGTTLTTRRRLSRVARWLSSAAAVLAMQSLAWGAGVDRAGAAGFDQIVWMAAAIGFAAFAMVLNASPHGHRMSHSLAELWREDPERPGPADVGFEFVRDEHAGQRLPEFVERQSGLVLRVTHSQEIAYRHGGDATKNVRELIRKKWLEFEAARVAKADRQREEFRKNIIVACAMGALLVVAIAVFIIVGPRFQPALPPQRKEPVPFFLDDIPDRARPKGAPAPVKQSQVLPAPAAPAAPVAPVQPAPPAPAPVPSADYLAGIRPEFVVAPNAPEEFRLPDGGRAFRFHFRNPVELRYGVYEFHVRVPHDKRVSIQIVPKGWPPGIPNHFWMRSLKAGENRVRIGVSPRITATDIVIYVGKTYLMYDLDGAPLKQGDLKDVEMRWIPTSNEEVSKLLSLLMSPSWEGSEARLLADMERLGIRRDLLNALGVGFRRLQVARASGRRILAVATGGPLAWLYDWYRTPNPWTGRPGVSEDLIHRKIAPRWETLLFQGVFIGAPMIAVFAARGLADAAFAGGVGGLIGLVLFASPATHPFVYVGGADTRQSRLPGSDLKRADWADYLKLAATALSASLLFGGSVLFGLSVAPADPTLSAIVIAGATLVGLLFASSFHTWTNGLVYSGRVYDESTPHRVMRWTLVPALALAVAVFILTEGLGVWTPASPAAVHPATETRSASTGRRPMERATGVPFSWIYGGLRRLGVSERFVSLEVAPVLEATVFQGVFVGGALLWTLVEGFGEAAFGAAIFITPAALFGSAWLFGSRWIHPRVLMSDQSTFARRTGLAGEYLRVRSVRESLVFVGTAIVATALTAGLGRYSVLIGILAGVQAAALSHRAAAIGRTPGRVRLVVGVLLQAVAIVAVTALRTSPAVGPTELGLYGLLSLGLLVAFRSRSALRAAAAGVVLATALGIPASLFAGVSSQTGRATPPALTQPSPESAPADRVAHAFYLSLRRTAGDPSLAPATADAVNAALAGSALSFDAADAGRGVPLQDLRRWSGRGFDRSLFVMELRRRLAPLGTAGLDPALLRRSAFDAVAPDRPIRSWDAALGGLSAHGLLVVPIVPLATADPVLAAADRELNVRFARKVLAVAAQAPASDGRRTLIVVPSGPLAMRLTALAESMGLKNAVIVDDGVQIGGEVSLFNLSRLLSGRFGGYVWVVMALSSVRFHDAGTPEEERLRNAAMEIVNETLSVAEQVSVGQRMLIELLAREAVSVGA